jgi:hypothetical protein
MPSSVDITQYFKGEHVEITFFAKDRDNSPLDNAASATITMTVAETTNGAPFVTFSTASDITLVDAPTAEFLISLSATDLTPLMEGRTYYYNIWSGTTQKTLQAFGKFLLQPSIEEV